MLCPKRVAALLTALLTILITAPALADQPAAAPAPSSAPSSSILEEVVVSAQKREQNIQDVGISIAAFSGEQIQALGVTSSFDIAAFTPGVHISGNLAGQNTQFTIRGVTQNDFNDIVEAPNAAYLDEGYIAIAQAQTFGVYDIDRVEILKGPQGTLFGRNATGGLVHYISRKPSFDKVSAFTDVTLGMFDSPTNAFDTRVEAAIGGPFSDRVAGRVAVLYRKHDGYLKNLYPSQAPTGLGSLSPGPGAGADMGDDDTIAGRGTLDFKAGASGLFRISVNYARSKIATGPYQAKSTIGIVDPAGELTNVIDTPANETRLTIQGAGDGGGNAIDGSALLPGAGIGLAGRAAAGGDFFGYKDPDGAGWTTSGDFAFKHQGDTKTTGVNLRFEWPFANGVSLTSVTDYKKYNKLLFIDVDSAPVNQLANYAGVDARSVTQELRLAGNSDRTNWVAGVYYLDIDNHSDNGLKAPVNSIINTLFGAPFDIGVVSTLKTKSFSAFGQLEYAFTDKLKGILGGRYINEKKDFTTDIGFFLSQGNFTVNQSAALPDVPLPGAPFLFSDSKTQGLWAAKAQLEFKPNENLLLYGGINRGVKAGSYNAPLLGSYLGSGGNASLPYNPEKLLAYEVGFKSTLQGGRTRLNGGLFYYDYKDYQAFLFVGVGGVVINADAKNIGGELELQTNITDGLDLIVGVSKFDATVKDIPLRFGSPLPPRDVKPTYAPELQASVTLRYEWPALGGRMNVRGSANYSDKFYYNLRNFDADKFPAYTMVNAGLGWASNNDAWNLSLDVRNVTDEKAGIQGFDLATLCGCNEVSYQPPRWYGVSMKYSF